MYYIASKILQPLLWPLNIAMGLVVVILVCLHFKRERWAKVAALATLVLLWTTGMPLVGATLFGSLESRYPVLTTAEAPKADAVVVLGGTVLGIQPPRREVQEVFGSRVVSAARLYRAGKASFAIVSSGVPYRLPDGTERTDGLDMHDLLVEEGVPKGAVLVESRSRNTDENARYTAEIMKSQGMKSILLVTSGFHMRRAMAMFRKYGVEEIAPFPVEIRVTHNPFSFWDLVPDMGSLSMTTGAIKEYIGRLFY